MSSTSMSDSYSFADCLELRGLVISAICGALPEERTRKQPLEIDLDIYFDQSSSGQSDDLSQTVDYGAVTAAVQNVVETLEPQLLEHLAQKIAEVVLRDAMVNAVTVSVRKLRPPVPQVLSTSGVRITRSR